MEQSIRAQALLLLVAFLGGAGLGLVYDLLRPIRRRGRGLLWDLLFCAAAAALCFVFAMHAERGRIGIWELCASLLGFCLYVEWMSPALFPIFEKGSLKIFQFAEKIRFFLKKVPENAKKLFPIRRE